MGASMLRLLTLGGLSIERDGRPLDHLSGNRKGLALLAVLAVHGKVGRDRLMAILWPESDGERARGSLKQTVHSLRRQLAEPDLLLGMTELRLNPDRIEADVQLFSLALERGDAEEAASLYAGPFLDGVYLDGTAEFEHWLDGRRDELASRHREALESLAVVAGARGDLAAEVAWWRRLQGADPLNSRAALRLMEALERSGDRAAALRHAQVHERLLLEELDVSLDPTVAEFVERLRASFTPWVAQGSAGSDSAGDGARQAGPETLRPARASTPNTGRRRRPLLQAGGLLAGGILLALGALVAGLLFTNARAGSGPDGEGSLLAGGDGPSPLASVAVLPFLDLSPDRDLEYLADGIAEEILNSLAGIQEIRVPARTSSFYFKGRNLPIREIARQLSVDHVLEGSLRTDGDRIRVTAQLIDARTDQHLWSRNFEPEFDDLFAVQDEIARTVADALRVRLAPGAEASFHPPTGDPAAHDLYLRGLFHWNRRSAPDLLLAIQFFTEATERDPGYARAWAGLALVYAVIPIGFIPPLPTDLARARLEEAADRALALEEGLRAGAPMMVQLGHIPWFDPLRDDARFVAMAREVGFP